MKEFNLSDYIENLRNDVRSSEAIRVDKVKEFIKWQEQDDDDWVEDIIDLIEINVEGKKDLIRKMRMLCKFQREEKRKLIGENLK